MLWFNNEVNLSTGGAESPVVVFLLEWRAYHLSKPLLFTHSFSHLWPQWAFVVRDANVLVGWRVFLEACCLDLIHPDGMPAKSGVAMKSRLNSWRITDKRPDGNKVFVDILSSQFRGNRMSVFLTSVCFTDVSAILVCLKWIIRVSRVFCLPLVVGQSQEASPA